MGLTESQAFLPSGACSFKSGATRQVTGFALVNLQSPVRLFLHLTHRTQTALRLLPETIDNR